VAIRLAQQNLAGAGLANVGFHRTAASTLAPDGSFDFILTWDCLHDMTDPAAAMRSIRADPIRPSLARADHVIDP
jgi:hypothetical protein